ncbi:DUF3718 domain-containing protein [Colwellia sp. 12G3]|uniref:DUF3718 domain-containing protein n=1 Tax=Colwellia sp. 12G3 TaxID=2058299 RepID=UPI000C32A40F|nr:DUF3718 domain-containing protein [Colwellia sp. 12G3]PKI17207.1 hypothetical protein CXF71_05325 [Colwellia sp. 12G3]
MKKLNLILAVVVFVLLSFSANATKYKFIAEDRSIETKICVFAGSNNKLGLKHALRQSTGSAITNNRFSVNNITCNDMVMAHFAHKYDAFDTYSYLNRLTNSKNKIPTTSIEIKDVSAVFNLKNEETKIIYVGSAK